MIKSSLRRNNDDGRKSDYNWSNRPLNKVQVFKKLLNFNLSFRKIFLKFQNSILKENEI